jgi:hypothetical protein
MGCDNFDTLDRKKLAVHFLSDHSPDDLDIWQMPIVLLK